MRVIHVVPSLAARTGGPAVGIVESALALQVHGIESTIFATDMAFAASAARHRPVAPAELPSRADELDVRLFPVRAPRRLAYSPALDRALAGAAATADLIHVHSLFLHPQFAASRRARAAGVPYVVSPHGALDPYLRRRNRLRKVVTSLAWQNRMLSGAAALHLTTDEEARLLADITPHVPRVVVANGVDTSAFADLPDGNAFRARYLDGFSGPTILFLGRVSFKKGIDVLLRAFAVLPARLDARLVVAGPDDEGLTPSLERLAADLGVRDRVVFAGMVVGEERLDALAVADVWVLPSHTENFAVAAVEALAAGRTVVISPAVNIAPTVTRAKAGVVVAQEPVVLADAMTQLLDDPARRAELGRRAVALAREYDWSRVSGQLAAMYRSVAANTIAVPLLSAGARA